MSVGRCINIEDLRQSAKRRLPAPVFDYLDGGADDEWSLRWSTVAYESYELCPRSLVDTSSIDLSTRILGCEIKLPILLSPTGMSRLFHHDKELGVARAAAKFGTMYSLSTMATSSLEEVAAATTGPKMFQMYVLKDRGLTREFVQRCQEAKYDALCLTVDTPLAGNRERDKRSGMIMPPRLTLKSLLSFVMSPHWSWNVLRDPDFRLANVANRFGELSSNGISPIEYVNSQFDRSVTWEDAEWLARQWHGPFVIKGILTAEDARRALEIGASAVMVSNHGGRQLDSTPAPIDCLRPIRDAIGSGLELILDGGIRRGTHVLKALALGANACSVGRAYLYGLAAGGQAGVELALTLLTEELRRDMALLGCQSIAAVSADRVRPSVAFGDALRRQGGPTP